MSEKKMFIITFISMFIVAFMLVFVIVVSRKNNDNSKIDKMEIQLLSTNTVSSDDTSESSEELGELSNISNGKINSTEENVVSYIDSDSSLDIDSVLDIDAQNTHEALANLCIEYNYAIPFGENGRYYGYSFPKYNNISKQENYMYLDALGYVIWAYRQVFGYTVNGVDDPVSYYWDNISCQIAPAYIQVGDIGMLSVDENYNDYGICVGFVEGVPVFSHCSNAYNSNFPNGCTQLSYLKMSYDSYYNGSAPVDYQYFVRIEAEWRDE